MDKNLLAEFKQLLLQQKAALEKQLGTVADKDVTDHVPGAYAAKFPKFGEEHNFNEDNDSADEVEAYEVNLAVTGDLEKHLEQVEQALERIENGTYGLDIHTGEPIALERLRVNPSATTAIAKPAKA